MITADNHYVLQFDITFKARTRPITWTQKIVKGSFNLFLKIIIWVSISFILFFEKVSKSDRLRNKYTLYFMHALWKVMLGIVF